MTDKAGAGGAAAADDDELSVPRASVNKIIKELAPNMRISNETRELIINCCNEFIHLIASESNEVCNQQTKKTIAPEHVLLALENLGFQSYLSEVKDCVSEAKEVAQKKRRQSTKLENLGIPEEELLRQQQELFAKAREEQAAIEQQEWQAMQQQANMHNTLYQQQAMMGYTPPPAGTHYQMHNPQANMSQVQQAIPTPPPAHAGSMVYQQPTGATAMTGVTHTTVTPTGMTVAPTGMTVTPAGAPSAIPAVSQSQEDDDDDY